MRRVASRAAPTVSPLKRLPMNLTPLRAIAFSLATLIGLSQALAATPPVKVTEIDEVWAANTVNFALKTHGERQFIAYYDAQRMMTVAMRELDSDQWTKTTLPSRLHWDSHNYVDLGIDQDGYIHVSGNMHGDPLVYFRSERPYDISAFLPVHRMTGQDEDRVTYPKFFNTRDGDLLYSYRIGGSGNGNIFVNRFLPETLSWERYLDEPLFLGISGNETRSAYHQYTQDDAGNLHFAWIWRWTPMVATSHNIGYATTPDLKHWENGLGESVSLPFRPDDAALMVDPVPSHGGGHNGRVKQIIDADGKPIIGYVKYDENGKTQVYVARAVDGAWMSKQVSDWDFRWEFHGGGDGMTIGGNFSFAGISPEGLLVIDWQTEKGDSGQFVLDAQTLERSDKPHSLPPPLPAMARERLTDNPNLNLNLQLDNGKPANGRRYFLKWEAGRRTHSYKGPGEEPAGPLSKLLLVEH